MKNKEKYGLHYGWVIVFVGFLLMWFVTCVFSSCSGMMVKPVSEDMGITRSQFSLAATFFSVAGMIVSIFVGKMYRKFTVKKTMLAGAIIFALCNAGFGISPNIYVYYIFAFIAGFAAMSSTMTAISTLLSRWFNEKRGLALALASTGSGIGGVIMNPFIGKLVTTIGWRKTYFVVAVIIAVVLIPAILLLIKDFPSDKGVEPYGEKINGSFEKEEESGMYAFEARKTPMFWLFVPVCMIVSISCNCIMHHTVAYATDIGYDYTFAAGIASVLTAGLAIGKIIMGQLFDSMGSRKAGTISLSIYVLCLVLYLFADNTAILYVSTAIFGFGGSFATIAFSVIVQDIFGKKDYATIFGNITVFSSLGGAIGSPAIAAVYDTLGTYKPAWACLAILMFVALIFLNIVFISKEKYEKNYAV